MNANLMRVNVWFVVDPNKEALFNMYSCYGCVHLSARQCMAVVSGLQFSDPALSPGRRKEWQWEWYAEEVRRCLQAGFQRSTLLMFSFCGTVEGLMVCNFGERREKKRMEWNGNIRMWWDVFVLNASPSKTVLLMNRPTIQLLRVFFVSRL